VAAAQEELTINVSREDFFRVIADVERYPDFLPDVVNVTVLERTDDTITARFELEMMMRIEYVIKLHLEAPTSLRWSLVEGRLFQKNDGAWKLEEGSDSSTHATYTLDVELTRAIPSGVAGRLLGSSLPQTVQRFRERAEQLCASETD
jgi:ribosome-associated toxin RatA of RatAB toxin-antitoxin module